MPEGYQLTRKYTVRRAIGRGSFGTVYQVYDNLADADRAVKIVDRDHVSLVARTQQEYQTLLRLPPHENVVKVENADYLDDTGVPYLVFEYLDGKDVGKLVKMRALGPADTIRLGIQVATGLKFLHERGVIHCDIKPGNLLWTDHGCKIIDFNVAVTEESSLSRAGGTAKYGPPDMNRSAPPTLVDLKDRDVYGLGVTLYQVLTGRFPFPSGAPSLGETAADPRVRQRAEGPVGRGRDDAPEGHRPAARGQVRQRRGVPRRSPGDHRGPPQADARARALARSPPEPRRAERQPVRRPPAVPVQPVAGQQRRHPRRPTRTAPT